MYATRRRQPLYETILFLESYILTTEWAKSYHKKAEWLSVFYGISNSDFSSEKDVTRTDVVEYVFQICGLISKIIWSEKFHKY